MVCAHCYTLFFLILLSHFVVLLRYYKKRMTVKDIMWICTGEIKDGKQGKDRRGLSAL